MRSHKGAVMEDSKMDLHGSRLAAYFQRYFTEGEAPRVLSSDLTRFSIEGEILTRLANSMDPARYFSRLALRDEFIVLKWQLRLKDELFRLTNAGVSINVHSSMVENGANREKFLGAIAASTAPATFEFTESYAMPPVGVANALLAEMRSMGHRTAMDDFGMGLNGMSLLTDYDFDIIKIDRSLIADLPERSDKREVLALLHRMLEVLGKAHVVEGVETEIVHTILLEAGYSVFQGFLFHRPEPISETIKRAVQEGPPTPG